MPYKGEMISFVETKLFTRLVQDYFSDDEYSRLQQALLAHPEVGAVIQVLAGYASSVVAWLGEGSEAASE